MTHANRGFVEALRCLNVVTAFAMMAFAVMGLIMVGIAGDVVTIMETYKFLPLSVTFGAYAVIFASSGTRNPEHYHPAEWFIVALTGVLMIAHAVLAEVQSLIESAWPYGPVAVLLLMTITSAILAR